MATWGKYSRRRSRCDVIWSESVPLKKERQLKISLQGQKARVNMARALYRDADIYLMDDPLSAVDVKVSKHLFEKYAEGIEMAGIDFLCNRSIKHHLRHKICILATHQIQFLQDAKMIIVLNNVCLCIISHCSDLFLLCHIRVK